MKRVELELKIYTTVADELALNWIAFELKIALGTNRIVLESEVNNGKFD